MNKTSQLILMATLCLNFAYGQDAKNRAGSRSIPKINVQDNLPYKYDFSGVKSDFPAGYHVSNDNFMKGKTITVRNYTVKQLFALALAAGNTACPVIPAEGICTEVREPKKLEELRCFKLVVPFYLSDNFYVIMQQCLNAEFPDYVVKMEIRNGAGVMVIKDRVY